MRKAFTLIELLVVIAIIAILAAILFPVFAQAKAAAKKTAALSNVKQLVLGVIMYNNDSDDVMPPDASWNTGNDALCPNGGAEPNCFSPWGYSIYSYIKNDQIFYDPQASPTAVQNNNPASTATVWTNFGYNYAFLSPYNGTQQVPVSDTAAGNPSSTVMLASRGTTTESATPYQVYGFGYTAALDSPILQTGVEVPDCTDLLTAGTSKCMSSWGVGGFAAGANTVAAGMNTGGVSVRTGGQAVVGFLDGHAKAMSAGNLAAGTTWTPTSTPSQVTYTTDYLSTYLWDLN